MKFLKKIFNRFVIISLLVLLQVVFFISFIIILEEKYLYLQVATIIIGVLVLLAINCRNMHVEAKFAWSILIILFPLLGIITYILFSKNIPTKKQKRILENIKEQHKKIKNNNDIKIYIEDKYHGQINYILNATNKKGYSNNKTTFFESGETFFEDLLNELKKAKEYIFMEYFIIKDDFMFNQILNILKVKIQEGLTIKILYDDLGTINYLPHDFDKKLRDIGIDCVKFNPFIPIVSSIHNNRDHRKITIIDGKIAYTGGINIGDEYINKKQPFGKWKDTSIKIQGPAVDSFIDMFTTLFIYSSNKNMDISKYKNKFISYNSYGIVVPFGDGPSPLYPDYIAENIFLNLINQAEKELLITTPYLICDNNLIKAIKNAALRGVNVKLFTPHIPDKKIIFQITRSNYKDLLKAGVKIFEYTPGFLHSKQILADEKIGVVGTINFDYRSLVHHYECGVWFYNIDCIKNIKDDFIKLEQVSTDMTNFKQNKILFLFCKSIELFHPLL